MVRASRILSRCGRLLPILILCQTLGCLPNDAIRTVLAENIVQTLAITIQSFVAIVFGNLFPFV